MRLPPTLQRKMGLFSFLIAGAAVAAYAIYSHFADDGEDRPPSRPQSPSPHIPSRRHDDWQSRQTIDPYPPVQTYTSLSRPRSPSPYIPSRQQTIDSPDVDYLPVEAYASLRAKARQEGNLMSQSYQQSQEAYERREHALAKKLSDQGKRHAFKMERSDAQASAIIFKENNRDRPAGEVDLHGLHVKEAISFAEKALKKARRRGDFEIRLIVGQGNHSNGGIPRLKPALQKAMRMHGAHVDVDPGNPGVLQLVV